MTLSNDLLKAAAELVIARNEPPIALLQRYFKPQYTAALRLMDRLVQAGVVVISSDGMRTVAPAHRTHCQLDAPVQPADNSHTASLSVVLPSMKYQTTLDRIRGKKLSKGELRQLRENALRLHAQGDVDAQTVLDEIDLASPADKEIVFMGFCPDADSNNRLDTEWKAKGICSFQYPESEHQLARFNDIWPGDLIVLKKTQQFGKTMRLYGHGRVTGVKYAPDGVRYLEMNWSSQDSVIEVPLMGAGSTVNVKSIEQVEAEMPADFYRWLNQDDNSLT